jgi:hypothetical protein
VGWVARHGMSGRASKRYSAGAVGRMRSPVSARRADDRRRVRYMAFALPMPGLAMIVDHRDRISGLYGPRSRELSVRLPEMPESIPVLDLNHHTVRVTNSRKAP